MEGRRKVRKGKGEEGRRDVGDVRGSEGKGGKNEGM